MDALKILSKASQIAQKVVLGLLVAFLLSQVVMAQAATNRVPFDPAKRQQYETVVRLYWSARTCMYTGSKAMLRNGVRDRNAITYFTVTHCTPALYSYLVSPMGWEEADIIKLFRTIADLELDAAAFHL